MTTIKTQQQPKAKQSGNPPIAKFQDGLITVSVWQRQTEKGAFYSVSHERRYKDDNDQWHSSDNYADSEIQTLRKLLDMAHTHILVERAESRSQKS